MLRLAVTVVAILWFAAAVAMTVWDLCRLADAGHGRQYRCSALCSNASIIAKRRQVRSARLAGDPHRQATSLNRETGRLVTIWYNPSPANGAMSTPMRRRIKSLLLADAGCKDNQSRGRLPWDCDSPIIGP